MFTERREDMGAGRLRINKHDDGDVGVVIIDGSGQQLDVEFCTPGTGGGDSPKTIKALRALADAIDADNKQNDTKENIA